MALESDPEVLFLDEPTLGLDPQARRGLWQHIAGLKGTMTILLTTHHLEEADALADRIAIMDTGRMVAQGTPAELKAGVSSGPVVAVACTALDGPALAELQTAYPQAVTVSGGVEIPGDDIDFVQVQQVLGRHGVTVDAIGHKQESLDDVFLALTGKQWRE